MTSLYWNTIICSEIALRALRQVALRHERLQASAVRLWEEIFEFEKRRGYVSGGVTSRHGLETGEKKLQEIAEAPKLWNMLQVS